MREIFSTEKAKRMQHNTEVLGKFNRGESLSSFSSHSSWFPPRPIVKKDKGAVRKLYSNVPPVSTSARSEPVKILSLKGYGAKLHKPTSI